MKRTILVLLLATIFVFSPLVLGVANSACATPKQSFWITRETFDKIKCDPPVGDPNPKGGCTDDGTETKSLGGVTLRLCCCPDPAKAIIPEEAIPTALGLISTTPGGLVSDLSGLALGIIGGVTLLLLVLGGFKYATSHGSPDGIMDAKNTITAALTGLAVIVFSVLILGLLGVNVFGLPGFSWSGTNLLTPN